NATGVSTWNNVLNECYDLISNMQTNYSATTGLIPDFIKDTDGNPKPAHPGYLEGDFDGEYNYNSCRVPWRLGTDYLVNGDNRSKTACDKINSWIKPKTSNNVNNIRSGYYLNGNNLPGNNYQDLSFIAPFAVSAMVNSTNQTWLNDLWSNIKAVKINRDGYYGNTIKMQAMIVLSGNWWAPQQVLKISSNTEVSNAFSYQNDFTVYPNPALNNCEITFHSNDESDAEISVFNQVGQLVLLQKSASVTKGLHTTAIELSGFEEGLYYIMLRRGNILKSEKLLVVR
ncbi:MAG TPA: glycosyl hydrolase family 8, partial [Chitinophagales bacterium]|nr:glycosyl hydrolase family 8 [Chitinophagales bacterium]